MNILKKISAAAANAVRKIAVPGFEGRGGAGPGTSGKNGLARLLWLEELTAQECGGGV